MVRLAPLSSGSAQLHPAQLNTNARAHACTSEAEGCTATRSTTSCASDRRGEFDKNSAACGPCPKTPALLLDRDHGLQVTRRIRGHVELLARPIGDDGRLAAGDRRTHSQADFRGVLHRRRRRVGHRGVQLACAARRASRCTSRSSASRAAGRARAQSRGGGGRHIDSATKRAPSRQTAAPRGRANRPPPAGRRAARPAPAAGSSR